MKDLIIKAVAFIRSPVSIPSTFLLALLAACAFTLTGFLGRWNWLLELTSHFRVQYAVVLLICLAYFLITKRRLLAGAALVFAITNIGFIVPWYFPDARSSNPGRPIAGKLKILLMNVHTENDRYERTARVIKVVNPDVLALQEISRRWLSALDPVLADFPSQEYVPRWDNFGIGVFSRTPFQDVSVEYHGSAWVPSIVARIVVGDQPVTILCTHPVPPGTPKYSAMRNEQLDAVAALRDEFGGNLILVGDLNMSPWSPYFKPFLSGMNLRDTRQGYGIQPSWPAFMPLLWIPLDHCLVSENIITLDRRIGRRTGSDHYPVIVELGILEPGRGGDEA